MRILNSCAIVALAGALCAQQPGEPGDPRSSFKVNLPADAPLSLVSADWSQSRATALLAARLVLDFITVRVRATSE